MQQRQQEPNENDVFIKECKVCGDLARGFNFNVLTCMSCKSFFRRNACKISCMPICQFENDCSITKRTRSYCLPCRLKKCLAAGMDPLIMRNNAYPKNSSTQNRRLRQIEDKMLQLPTPLPLSLLRNDRSTLTNNEWTLLTNFLHAFDAHTPSTKIQQSLDQLSSLHPKLRSKPSEVMKIFQDLYSSVVPMIECSSDFYFLSFDARQALIKHNLYITGIMHGFLLCRELNIYYHITIRNTLNQIYGSEFIMQCSQYSSNYDPNDNLIKILIFLMAFSSNCSTVKNDEEESVSIMSSSIHLVRIQNRYVTMLWKYLIYLYGFKEAVVRYSYLVKNAVDVISMLNSTPRNDTRNRMMNTIVTETERMLVISN